MKERNFPTKVKKFPRFSTKVNIFRLFRSFAKVGECKDHTKPHFQATLLCWNAQKHGESRQLQSHIY